MARWTLTCFPRTVIFYFQELAFKTTDWKPASWLTHPRKLITRQHHDHERGVLGFKMGDQVVTCVQWYEVSHYREGPTYINRLCKPVAPSSLSVGGSPHILGDAGGLPFPHCQKYCRDAGKLDQLTSGAGNIIFRAKEVRKGPCPKNWADFF